MLVLHARAGETRQPPQDLGAAALAPDVIWIDLLQPSAEERAFVERATGLKLPDFADLSEIESSSRLRTEQGALYLSAPLVYRVDVDDPPNTTAGVILPPGALITHGSATR